MLSALFVVLLYMETIVLCKCVGTLRCAMFSMLIAIHCAMRCRLCATAASCISATPAASTGRKPKSRENPIPSRRRRWRQQRVASQGLHLHSSARQRQLQWCGRPTLRRCQLAIWTSISRLALWNLRLPNLTCRQR